MDDDCLRIVGAVSTWFCDVGPSSSVGDSFPRASASVS